jgi:hypothetical protein
MNLKKWMLLQKEGFLVGALWGLISIPAALGLATTYTSLAWYHKLLILPVYLSNLLPNLGIMSAAYPIFIGAIIGVIVDMFYKPDQ